MEKTNSAGQCERCRIFKPLCVCAELPRHELETRIVVIMHFREQVLTTNTARLAELIFPNSEIRIRGGRIPPLRLKDVVPEGYAPALLFPADDAIELTPEVAARLRRPLALIVPDGSWRQARKVHTRENALDGVPRFKLPSGAPSTFRLRHSPHPENLSTFEAIARAIGAIHGAELQTGLERAFLTVVERRLWAQGKLAAEDAVTGIPQAAFDAQRRAGMLATPCPPKKQKAPSVDDDGKGF